jgi:spermidine synthase
MDRLIIYFLFFASGTASLIYEVLWVRILGLTLGVTVYATSLVLISYMAGLALGSALWGRYIDTVKNGFLKKYASLELAIGLSALGISTLFIQASKIYFLSLPYVVLYPAVFCLLLLPTFFMGGTLPIMSKYLVQKPGYVGKDAGTLYALNTFGGVAGCFAAGFFLIRIFGVNQSMSIAVAINVLVAIAALALALKRNEIGNKLSQVQEHTQVRLDSEDTSGLTARHVMVILVLYGISGFCSLGYEVLWTRALMFKIGNDTYAFSLMLCTYLLGLALGSFIFARISLTVRKMVFVLGLLQLLIALTIALGIGLLYRMDAVIDTLWLHTGQTWLSAIAARFISSFLLMGIPTLCIGGIFPLVARLSNQSLQTIGKNIGGLYSVNTLGTIFGTGVTGFILLPFLGIRNALYALTMINLLVGSMFFFLLPGKKRVLTGFSGAALIMLIVLFTPGAKPLPLTAAHLARSGEKYDLLYYREGASATVSVIRTATGTKMLNVNGVYTAFTTENDLQVHYLLGVLPYLFANDARDALVIGLGLGVTSSSLALTGAHVDCVELAREEIGSTPYLSDYNDTLFAKRNFRLIIDDGRHYLLNTKEKFDIITSNAVHVRMSPYLYTREFYQLCRERLNIGGAVCQWLPTNNIPQKEFMQLIRAFSTVFPHATVWYVNPGHFLLLGTNRTLEIDYDRIKQRLQRKEIFNELRKVNLDNPAIVMSLLLMNEYNVSAYAGAVMPHTDDHPAAEFVRVLESRTPNDCISIPSDCRVAQLPLDDKCGEKDRLELKKAFSATQLSRNAESASWAGELSKAVSGFHKALELYPADSRTEFLEKNAETQMVKVFLRKGEDHLAKRDLVSAMNEFNKAMDIDSNFYETYANIGLLYKMKGYNDSALAMLEKGAFLNQNLPVAYFNLGMFLLEKGEMNNAIVEFSKASRLDTSFADAYFGQGFCYYHLGDLDRAKPAFRLALEKGVKKEYAETIHRFIGE